MVADLHFETRTETGTRRVAKLREQGKIPAVIYGEGKPAKLLSVEERTFVRLVHGGERVLNLTGGEGNHQALIKDIQYDPFGEQMLHVDFHELKAGQKVTVKVALSIKGTPKGAVDGGQINQVLFDAEVECLPTAIPEKLIIDVSHLEIGDSVKVEDIAGTEGVSILAKPDTVIALCEEPRKAIEPSDEPVEGESSEPEVLTEKKEEDAPSEEKK